MIYQNETDIIEAHKLFLDYFLFTSIIQDKYLIKKTVIFKLLLKYLRDKHPLYFDIIFKIPSAKNNLKLIRLNLKLRNLKITGNKKELLDRLSNDITKNIELNSYGTL